MMRDWFLWRIVGAIHESPLHKISIPIMREIWFLPMPASTGRPFRSTVSIPKTQELFIIRQFQWKFHWRYEWVSIPTIREIWFLQENYARNFGYCFVFVSIPTMRELFLILENAVYSCHDYGQFQSRLCGSFVFYCVGPPLSVDMEIVFQTLRYGQEISNKGRHLLDLNWRLQVSIPTMRELFLLQKFHGEPTLIHWRFNPDDVGVNKF